jgi:elongation factor G
MKLMVQVPEAAAGDVVGDLNGRRGQILGVEPDDGGHVCIKAFVPQAELGKYAIVLRSLSHGRGTFSRHFDHYSAVPEKVARPLIESYQKQHHAA